MTTDGPCRCWTIPNALGHPEHCCFLRDDRNRRNPWREVSDICHANAAHIDYQEDQQ